MSAAEETPAARTSATHGRQQEQRQQELH